jgi:hypothetical protein
VQRLRRPLAASSLLLALAAVACQDSAAEPPAPPAPLTAAHRTAPPASGGSHPDVQMRNVHMMVDPQVVLEVRSLQGELQPTSESAPPYFDDPASFRIAIERAEIAMTPASLSALLNRYTFAYPGAPLADLRVSIDGDRLHQEGRLREPVNVRFAMDAELSVTPDGLLRLHPTKVKAAGIPVRKLMDTLDIEMDELIKVRPERGLLVKDDDLLLDPRKLLPPPQVRGRVGTATLERDRIVLGFVPVEGVDAKRLRPSMPEAANYMFFRHGRLRFGKLTMDDTDLQIVDGDERDPFAFFLAQYQKQLVAGYSKTMPDKGLVAVMPDYDEAGR